MDSPPDSAGSESLPDDLMKEILARLPPRSVLRFRALSKSLRATIDSPDFIRQYLFQSSMSESRYRCYLYRATVNLRGANFFATRFDGERLSHDELNQHPIPRQQILQAKLIGSCNGLVCINHMKHIVILWNPWIRESYRIPQTGARNMLSEFRGVRVQNPVRHFHYGFGYNRLSDDYNVVRLVNHENINGPPLCEVKVFSLRNNSWRKLPDLPYRVLPKTNSFKNGALSGVFVEFSLHWFATDGSIVAVDLRSSEYRVIRQPNCVGQCEMVLGELGGSLCAMYTFFDYRVLPSNPYTASMWMMKEYGNADSWTKIVVDLPSGLGYAIMRPIRCSTDGTKIVLQNKELLQWYDVEQQIVVRTASINQGPSHVLEGYLCVGSLVKPSP